MLHGNFVFLNMYYGTGVVFFKVWLKKKYLDTFFLGYHIITMVFLEVP